MASLVPWAGGRSVFDPSDIWDPFDVNRSGLWDTDRWGWGWPSTRRGDDATAIARTYVDWRETDDAHIFTAELPGVRKDEVKVQVEDGNILRISGERTKEEETGTDTWHRVERRRGSFVRRFRLPDNADMNQIRCSLDHCLLTVAIPKKPTATQPANISTIDIA